MSELEEFCSKNSQYEDQVETTKYETRMKQYRWFHVNWDILPSKASYFFVCARQIGSLSSLVLFLTGIGLDKVEAGLILGFR